PFGRLASLIVSAGDRPSAEGFARKLAAMAPRDERVQVLGPAEAPLAVIKGRYRFRLLVKAARGFDLSDYLRQWLAAGPKTKGNPKLGFVVNRESFCACSPPSRVGCPPSPRNEGENPADPHDGELFGAQQARRPFWTQHLDTRHVGERREKCADEVMK